MENQVALFPQAFQEYGDTVKEDDILIEDNDIELLQMKPLFQEKQKQFIYIRGVESQTTYQMF